MSVTINVHNFGNALVSAIDPAYLDQVQMKIVLSIHNNDDIPECLGRQHFQNYLYLVDAKVGVEIGVQRGEFSKHLLSHWPGKLYMVDPWRHQPSGYVDTSNVSDKEHWDNYQVAMKNVEGFKGRYEVIKNFSTKASAHFKDNSLDFVFIDGNHSYKATTADLQAWTPKVREGGLVAGHDFIDLRRDDLDIAVRSAVLNFAEAGGYQVFCSREAWPSLWYFVKR